MMKKMIISLIAMLAIAAQASAMSYEQARSEALFLTDKMAYELNLSDAQYEAAYEINLDYLMNVTGRHNVFGSYWEQRNADIRYILYSWQWDAFCAASYFYRPLYWHGGYWHFGIYARYPHRNYYYFGTPHFYASYHGGHSWRMNGGRSFYEHRDRFRPSHHRNDHFGMRDGWNRGDYRGNGNSHSSSSTRVTGGNDRQHGGNSHFDMGNSRNNGNGNRNGNGNGNGNGNDNGNNQGQGSSAGTLRNNNLDRSRTMVTTPDMRATSNMDRSASSTMGRSTNSSDANRSSNGRTGIRSANSNAGTSAGGRSFGVHSTAPAPLRRGNSQTTNTTSTRTSAPSTMRNSNLTPMRSSAGSPSVRSTAPARSTGSTGNNRTGGRR